jgi:uncharacterized membrane protein
MRNLSNILMVLMNLLIILGGVVVLWHWLTPKANHLLAHTQLQSVEMLTFVALFFNFVKDLCNGGK